jgi:hypothetical protein
MEQEFNIIEKEYELFKQVNYVSANIDNIDEEIFNWKTKLQKFLAQYKDAEQNCKIIKMEQDIAQKREEIEILSKIIYIEPKEVPFFNPEHFESVITSLSIFGDKDSASASLILRGMYNCQPVFLKVFDSTSKYSRKELSIYKHISRVEEELKKDVKLYIDGFSIKLKLAFWMHKDEFFRFLEEKKIEIKTRNSKKLFYSSSSSDDAVIKAIPTWFSSNFLHFIVTEDIKGNSLRSFINHCDYITQTRKNLLSIIKKDFINLFFELFYSIYILNHYLKIEHNDLHLGNIMIKQVEPKKKEFIIGNLKIKKKSNWRVAIYDFDSSNVISEKTKVDVTKMWYKLITDRSLNIVSLFINIQLYIFNNNVTETIIDPEEPDLKNYKYEALPQDQKENLYYPENMLKRFIKVFFNELEIEEINPFYKKYLKYKNKYLKYKYNKL